MDGGFCLGIGVMPENVIPCPRDILEEEDDPVWAYGLKWFPVAHTKVMIYTLNILAWITFTFHVFSSYSLHITISKLTLFFFILTQRAWMRMKIYF